MENNLKLFVWEGVLTDFSSGIMFALATDVEMARAEVLKACDYVIEEDLAREPTAYEVPVGFAVWGGS
jgi:hypothetical protein